MSFSQKMRVGVLRGGPSPEYDISLETGKTVLKNLPEGCEPLDIFISKSGVWHEKGLEKSPDKILHRVDVVVNALHGKYGEDGEVQNIMDQFGVPYTGSGALASALCMNKIASKKIYQNHSLKTPVSVSIPLEKISRSEIANVYQNLIRPFVVKPSSGGSSIGIYLASTLTDLEDAVLAASPYSPAVLIEEFIPGKEATCGVVEGFRGHDLYPLMPIEIKHGKELFDYDSKYSDSSTEEICPGNFSHKESKEIERMAAEAHRALGLRHYSRSDFIVHPRRGIYILETNSLPGLTEKSLIPKALAAAGSSIREFLSHLISKALGK